MMQKIRVVLRRYRIFFTIMTAMEMMMILFLWLIDMDKIRYILLSLICCYGIFIAAAIIMSIYEDKVRIKTISRYIDSPNEYNEHSISEIFVGDELDTLLQIGAKLRDKDEKIYDRQSEIDEYEEYIESLAHEIKTQIGYMALVLDNRRDEMSKDAYKRLEIARTRVQEDIEKTLYYARLRCSHNDYLYNKIHIADIIDDIYEEYAVILSDNHINLINEAEDIMVLTDRKAIGFIVRQIISNSIKYIDDNRDESYIKIMAEVNTDEIILSISDNGIGVADCDMPFIFDRGFTAGRNTNSTGMGLYLARQVAQAINIQITADNSYKKGLKIDLIFPIIYKTNKTRLL